MTARFPFQNFFGVLLWALAAGCHPAAPPGGPSAPTGTLTFLVTGDLQGLWEPVNAPWDLDGDGTKTSQLMGGLARIAGATQEIRRENPGRVVLVSTGDDLMGRFFHFFRGKAELGLMTVAGYDVLAIGNHEFDKGPEVVAEALTGVGFPVLGSDLETAGTPLEGKFQRTWIKDLGGVRVGFFSLMVEDFPLVTQAGGVRLCAPNLEMAPQLVAELKAAGAEVIVGVTHIGDQGDRQLARNVPGIDVILGGHSHGFNPLERVGDTLIVNGGEKGVALVRLDIPLDSRHRPVPENARFSLIPLDGRAAFDPRVEKLVAGLRARLPAAIEIGRTDAEWVLDSSVTRRGEAPVGDLVVDLLREKFQVDAVLLNAGALRGPRAFPPGPITDDMLGAIDEFRNDMFRVKMKGQYIPEILERSAACWGEGGFMQVSGLRFTIDLRRPAQELERGPGDRIQGIKRPGERVSGTEIRRAEGWQAIDPAAEYTLLIPAFLYDREGDGYFWFQRYGTSPSNTRSTLYSVLAEFVGKKGQVDPPAPDGRIRVIQ